MNHQDKTILAQKLQDNTIADGDCIIWQGAKQSAGYGVARLPGGRQATMHRASWTLYNGCKPPKGAQINHTCHNRACVNPDHLRLGNARENAADMLAAGRESHRRVRLDLNEINLLRDLSHMSIHRVAEITGLCRDTVSRYRR